VADPLLAHSRAQDHAILHYAEARTRWLFSGHRGGSRLPAHLRHAADYTLLEAIRPPRGKLLHYDQYVHPDGYESVSSPAWPSTANCRNTERHCSGIADR